MYRTFAVVAVVALGCGAGVEDGAPTVGSDAQALRGEQPVPEDASCAPHRVLVCHLRGHASWPQPLCASLGALHAHLAHGDTPGDCPEIGTPPREDDAPAPWTPQVPTPPAQLDQSGGSQGSWTPQVPRQPAQVCTAAAGACQQSAECCDGLTCSAGLCAP